MFKILDVSLLERSIITATKSQCFDRIVVGTADSELMHMARLFKAKPFAQKKSESRDHVKPEVPLTRYLVENPDVKRVVMLFPTHPLLRVEDIQKGLGLLDKGYDSSFGAYKQYWLPEWDKKFKPKFDLYKRPNPSKMPETYIDNGSFYAFTVGQFRKSGIRHGENCRPWVMPMDRSISIEDKANLSMVKRLLV